ncbi:two-component sensor histidine kinase [Frigoribacterium sp. ACAM 257]|uniref:sensor histidine kinase n=1 Tax=Frigoribacterium sp. ACAM 257 TaxID=2508998 RepID=UPI0011BA1743|nr:histidine kinase [Frigoribacterium sp. ACAM 257]TWX34570.1 two-component sensor histidine kinase [Frigoribacterium sp. ACAM 257]
MPDSPRPPGAVRRWAVSRPAVVDALVALGYVVVSGTGLALVWLATGTGRPLGVDLLLGTAVAVSAAALLVRRRRPWLTFAVVTATVAAAALVDGGLDPLATCLALYSLAVHRSVRAAWIGLGVSVLADVAATAGAGLVSNLTSGVVGDATGASGVPLPSPVPVLLTLVAVLVGVDVGARRRRLEALVERAERLERERDQQARLATAAERARITREVHDIVSHGISVMVTLAEGADALARKDPTRSQEAVGEIVQVGRRSLGDMRRLLGALGDDDASAGADGTSGEAGAAGVGGSTGLWAQPQPGIDQLPELVASFRAAGLPVVVESRGVPAASEALQTAVHRIVQESLTNALRHAGSPTRVLVELDWGEQVAVTVTDDGAVREEAARDAAGGAGAAPRLTGVGRGLVGMRERARMYGGTVEAGPLPDGGDGSGDGDGSGGWRVAVVLTDTEEAR